MPIYDYDGTTTYKIARIYDNDGTTSRRIGKVYDNDGTTSYLIYSAEETLIQNGVWVSNSFAQLENSWNSGTRTQNGYWEMYGTADSGAYFGGLWGKTATPIDLTSMSTITIYGSGYDIGGGNPYNISRVAISTNPSPPSPFQYYADNWTNSMTKWVGIKDSLANYTIDVSDLSGSYYVHFAISAYNASYIWMQIHNLVIS